MLLSRTCSSSPQAQQSVVASESANEACTLFLHHIYVPAGFCAAGTCGRDNMPDHCDRTQAKQVWSLYDIVAPLQETLNFVAGSSRSLSLLARYCSAHRGPMLTDRSAAGDCALQPGRRVLQAQARTISRQQKAVCGKNKRNGQRCNYSQKDWCYTSVCKPWKVLFSAIDDMESCNGLEIEGSSLLPTIEEWF